MFTTLEDLAEALDDEFGGSKVKALASLNQLENKKQIYSKKEILKAKDYLKFSTQINNKAL